MPRRWRWGCCWCWDCTSAPRERRRCSTAPLPVATDVRNLMIQNLKSQLSDLKSNLTGSSTPAPCRTFRNIAPASCAFPASASRFSSTRGEDLAVSNVSHQNGPLGEGERIVHGCITCPWHGYQYKPDTGASPPPFEEKIPTFRVRVSNGRVFVHPRPNPAGERVNPALVDPDGISSTE